MNDDLRSKFIINENHSHIQTEKLIEKALNFGRVTQNGEIIIDDPSLTKEQTIKISLILRFLAHQLDDTINENVRPIELTKILSERIESTGSRLSLLTKSGFAKKNGLGLYTVQYHQVEKFLNQLESGNDATNKITKRQHSSQRVLNKNTVKSSKKSRGVGEDIQNLVNEGFFKTPKFIKEIKNKLEEEVKYHDIRLIDKIIRETFVSSKKTLKRLPNPDKGKAKWKYVNR